MTANKNIKLTIEEVDQHERFKHLSHDEKEALISFVYDLATILYYTCGSEYEQS